MHVSLNKLRFVVAVMCLLATSCSQSKESTINEPEARASLESYHQEAIEAIRRMGEMEPLPGETEDTIETCDSDFDGSYLGSDMIVLRSSWTVVQDGSAGFDAIAEGLAENSMAVTPYDPDTRALSAEAEGFKVAIVFGRAEGTSGKVILTTQSPCIDGIRDDS